MPRLCKRVGKLIVRDWSIDFETQYKRRERLQQEGKSPKL